MTLLGVDTSALNLPGVSTSRAAKVRVAVGLVRLVRVVKNLPKRMSAKVLLHGVDTSHWLCPECVRSTVEGSTPVEVAICISKGRGFESRRGRQKSVSPSGERLRLFVGDDEW
jgi:hypothetical protein